jgi:cell wall-associated NlpC family hydrolase
MSAAQTDQPSPRPRRLKFAFAAIGVLACAALLIAVVNPFAGDTPAAASDESSTTVTFDGEDFSGGGSAAPAGGEKVKTEEVANKDSEAEFASVEPQDASPHRLAAMPAASTTTKPAAGSASSKQVEKILKAQKRAGTADKVQLLDDGTAVAPLGAPDEVQSIVAAANAIAKFPYIWGGGHGSFVARGYDCSGSLNYAFKAAGLVNTTMVSGEYAKWGDSGPGKWVTIYANGGHVFMVVGGVRYDTSFRDGPRGTRWQTAKRSLAGFEVRHPPGL